MAYCFCPDLKGIKGLLPNFGSKFLCGAAAGSQRRMGTSDVAASFPPSPVIAAAATTTSYPSSSSSYSPPKIAVQAAINDIRKVSESHRFTVEKYTG